MKHIFAFVLSGWFLFSGANSSAQNPAPYGFGGYPVQEEQYHDEPSDVQRQAIIRRLRTSIAKLKIDTNARVSQPSENTSNFIFPVRQAAGYNDPGFYDIGNYIDKDPTSQIRDYMCNQRTYNTHRGTDIGIVPYGWEKVDNNAVEIISAADGVIIEKHDGYDDKNCQSCSNCEWNAVYVRNTDGTVCWYGHMKNGSLTGKPVGSSVAQGEYLGVVGSSGNSTGPHLHFEVWSDENHTSLIDPWDGTCNVLGSKTYWKSQLPTITP